MPTIDEYLSLITSEHRDKAKFESMVSLDVSLQVQVQSLMTQMFTTLFDLDLAYGAQLDIIGKWVGVSRRIKVPIPAVYFSWDADYTLGWEYGSWAPPSAPTSITELPDDAYRTLIRTKIAANRWDGTTTGAYTIWDSIFTAYTILIQDFQDMSYDLIIVGGIVDSLTLALLTGGYLPLKPEAIRINNYIVPVNDGPLFGWDLENDYIQGWETGSWGRELEPT